MLLKKNNMLKRILFIFAISCFCFHFFGQNYGNEWIDYSQKYYKFPVSTTGLYKIDNAFLSLNAIPISGVTSGQFQVFGRDKEIPLYMVDGGDNSFDPGDYFLFVADKNDGWLDSSLYFDPSKMANPGYSLISDTNYYYFSWKNAGTGLRFSAEPDQNFASYTPVSNMQVSSVISNGNTYVEGKVEGLAVGSIYTKGEGYGYAEVVASATSSSIAVSFNTPQLFLGVGGQKPELHTRVTSNSNAIVSSPPFLNHHLQLKFGSANILFKDTSFSGYHQVITNDEFLQTDLSNGNTPLVYEAVANVDGAIDRLVLTYAILNYSRNPNASGLNFDRFTVRNQFAQSKIRIDLSSLSGNPIVFGFGAQKTAVLPFNNAGVWQFNLPTAAVGQETDVRIFDQSSTITPNSIAAVSASAQFTDINSFILDSALILIYPKAFELAAQDYKNYRNSIAGGVHNTVFLSIEELYHQFGGGIQNGPAGIRRLVDYIYNQSAQKPVGLFLLGKGVTNLYYRTDPSALLNNFIPTFGHPSSDNAILSYLNGSTWEPLIPVGRISVVTNQELSDYLSKVQEYELKQNPAIANFEVEKDWQKQILHFVGGSNASQQSSFQSYMNFMKDIAEDTLFAGNVSSFFKTTSAPLDPNVVEGVTLQIEQGVSVMNFFGHAAASNNGFEINIDEPSNWNNTGKYPIVIGNSCYNGDIFQVSPGVTSERFVNLPNEGAIAFLSSVAVGYDVPLYYYSSELYRQFSHKNYGKTFGSQIKETIRNLYWLYGSSGVPSSNVIYEAMCSQMTLNGDPMLKINYSIEPEIHLLSSDLSLNPANVNLNVDSIYLTVSIKNLGMSISDSISVEIRRDFPGTTTDSIYNLTIPNLNYSYTLVKSFPLQAEIAAGINSFTVSVDLPSLISEQFEEVTNNTASANFFLNIDGINPIWPYNYAVVPFDTVTVKASTINPLADLKSYRFELDTTDTYDSPQFRTYTLSELGGVKEVRYDEWRNLSGAISPLTCSDSGVYFWRVAVDSSVLNWSEFSFQYIKDKWGWGQDHFFQFKNNNFAGLDYNRTNRLRNFPVGDTHQIYIQAFTSNDSYGNQWGIDGDLFDYATVLCGGNGIYVGVLDPITLLPWGTNYGSANPDHVFGNANTQGGACSRPRVENFFAFSQSDPAQLAGLENMLENEIPDGHYVVIYTTGATEYSNWTALQPSLYSTFTNIGSTLVNSSQPEAPFALIYRKGDLSSVVEKHYPDTVSDNFWGPHVYLKKTIQEVSFIGIETTPIIGPAFNWNTLYWRRDSVENVALNDSVRMRIQLFDNELNFQSTIDTVFTPNDSIINLNSLVNAATYPYLKLSVYTKDLIFNTPTQIERLHILYDPVPEAAIDGTNGHYFSLTNDTIFEGQSGSFAFDIKNVSQFPMDSLLVSYWIEDQAHAKQFISYPRQDSLRVGQIFRDTINFSSLDLAGYNVIWTEVNPYVNGSLVVTDQLEQYHFNNICQIPFYVVGDDEHPLLDVTFDGLHILNRDIIHPKSEILITLKDDNPYLIMNDISDTTHFGIYLTDPNGIQERIPFVDGQGNTILECTYADSGSKKFRIRYPANFLQDGIYQLSVQASDRSNNLSGDYAYKVEFEIIHESTITQMMNYPNPFSTSTRFVFTLTGTEVPDDIRIQVITVTGKVVKTINEEELGEIRIGRNITEYAWDGRDEFGDLLANGVYLYKVETKLKGSDIKLRESGADLYFEKEFGKMYLMR